MMSGAAQREPDSRSRPRRRSEARSDFDLAEAAARRLGARDAHTEADLARLIDEGLPIDTLEQLLRHGVTDAEVFATVIPRRTLAHRRGRSETLSTEESARAVRVARITALADRVFGDPAKARRWLRRPKRRLGGQAPMAALANELWARIVEEQLHQIDHGIFA